MPFNREFYIYILAGKSRRLYVGMTNSLFHRVEQHRRAEGAFTSRYRVHRLVYYETLKYVIHCHQPRNRNQNMVTREEGGTD